MAFRLLMSVVLGAAGICVGFGFLPTLTQRPLCRVTSNFCFENHGLCREATLSLRPPFASPKEASHIFLARKLAIHKASVELSAKMQARDARDLQSVELQYLDKIFAFVDDNGGKQMLSHIGVSVKRPKELGSCKLISIVQKDRRFTVRGSFISTRNSVSMEESDNSKNSNIQLITPKGLKLPPETPKSKFLDLVFNFVSQGGGKKSIAEIHAKVRRPKPFSGKLKDIIGADSRFCIKDQFVSLVVSMKEAPRAGTISRPLAANEQARGNSRRTDLRGRKTQPSPKSRKSSEKIGPPASELTGSLTAPSHGDIIQNMAWPRNSGFEPRSPAQASFVSHLLSDATAVVIGFGPAGCGKTFIACHMAIQKLMDGSIQRLVLTRPIVAADKDLGFLPGGVREKMHCWMLPMYDSLQKCVGTDTLNQLIDAGKVELSPLAYMRGRTFENCWVIGDEFQNCNEDQMRMILTRVGLNCKLVITGDPRQCDLPSRSNGLSDLISRITNSDFDTSGIAVTEFTGADVQRHAVVGKVLRLYGMLSDLDVEPNSALTSVASLQDLGTNTSQSRLRDYEICLVDDLPKLRSMLSGLAVDCYSCDPSASCPDLAIDIEGVKLGSEGEVCLVQIVSSKNMNRPYLVDICCLGSGAFTEAYTANGKEVSLKTILEDPSITKLMWDCRSDNNALVHLHGIRLAGVVDLQLHCMLWCLAQNPADPEAQELRSLHWALATANHAGMGPEERQAYSHAVEMARILSVPEYGGTYEAWRRRPLPGILLRYCTDAARFFALRAFYRPTEEAHAEALRLAAQGQLDESGDPGWEGRRRR